MKRLIYLFIIASSIYISRQLFIYGLDLNIDFYLDFLAVFSIGFIAKEVTQYIIELFNMSSMPLGSGSDNENVVNQSRPSSSNSSNHGSSAPANNAPEGSTSNAPQGSTNNNAGGNTSDQSSDTDWSDGQPMSPLTLEEWNRAVIDMMASHDPAHRVPDPTNVAEGGYRGGGRLGYDSENESNHTSDSGLDTGGIASIQPFATNLANYLENYKRDANAVYGMGGFPRMDERSLHWYIGYLNSNFPSHVGAVRLNPTSSRIIRVLRDTQ
jgi:hypothetical protein